MAIYHLHLKCQSRKSGQSVLAKGAYNSGTAIKIGTDYDAPIADYRRKQGVVFSELIGTEKTRQIFWQDVESAEKRSDACLSRELEIALPVELNRDQRIKLCRGFAQVVLARYDLAGIDVAMHEPPAWNRRKRAKRDAENPHGHFLFPDRDASGKKLRVLTDRKTGPAEVAVLRQLWAETCNTALRAAGVAEKIDGRSLEAQIAEKEDIVGKLERNLAILEQRKEKLDARAKKDHARAFGGDRGTDRVNEASARAGTQEEGRAPEARQARDRTKGAAGSREEGRKRPAIPRQLVSAVPDEKFVASVRYELHSPENDGSVETRPAAGGHGSPRGLNDRDKESASGTLLKKRQHTEEEWKEAAFLGLDEEAEESQDSPAPKM